MAEPLGNSREQAGLMTQFMLPDSQDAPASGAQEYADLAVARFIALQFRPPIGSIAGGHPSVAGATMPETAIHE